MSHVHPVEVVIALDLGERNSIDIELILEDMPFTRASLSGRRVDWSDYATIIERLLAEVGPEAFTASALRSHEVAGDFAKFISRMVDPATMYFFFAKMTPFLFRVMDARTERLDGNRLRFDVALHDGFRGSSAVFEYCFLGLATLTAHLGLPVAQIESVEASPRGGRYVLVMPPVPARLLRRRAPTQEGVRTQSDMVRSMLDSRLGPTRDRVRDEILARLATDLAAERELHAITRAVVAMLVAQLPLDGVTVSLGVPRISIEHWGAPEGIRIRRALRFAGDDLGMIEGFVRPDRVGEVTVALDLIAPWVASAVGAALAEAAQQSAALRREQDSRALAEVIAAVDAQIAEMRGAVFALHSDGRVIARNDAARARPSNTNDPRAASFDVVHGHIDGSLLLVERRHPLALARSVDAFAERIAATAKERAVLEHLAAGKSNKEIGAALECAEVTVETHLSALFRRAAVRGRVELLLKVLAP